MTLIRRINRIIAYARDNSPYYNRLFKRIRYPKKTRDLSQFESIPITFRDDLSRMNEMFIAVPKEEWADVVNTSGTSGRSIYMPFTKGDIVKNAHFIARKFSTFGLRKDDLAYITVPMGQSMWIGGLSIWLGCLETATCSLRAGAVGMDKHREFMERFRPTVIFGLPSFILRMGEEFKKRGLSNISKPRLIVTFGENIMNRDFSRNSLGRGIEKAWDTKVISGYCSSEASPGFECISQQGHHILSKMVYVEVVDCKTLEVLKTGEEGLVVITHFGREGLPLIRYANGDISFLVKGRCRCGRAASRLGPVLRRMDEMIKVKGINIYPQEVETFLSAVPFIEDFRVELLTEEDRYDSIKIIVTFKNRSSKSAKMNIVSHLEDRLRDKFGVKIGIEESGGFKKEATEHIKTSRIIDKRIRM